MGKPIVTIGQAFGVIDKPKSQEQPQVAAQINSPQPLTSPTGPTSAEMAAQNAIDAKRRGRKATILTSGQGLDTTATLGYRTLLG